MTVALIREDGFDGEILLEAEGLPAGVACAPQVIGPKLTEAALVFQAAADAPDGEATITIKGTATINGQKVVRAAQAGRLVGPPPTTSRPSAGWPGPVCLAVRDKGVYTLDTDVKELAVPVGGSVAVKVKANRQLPDFKDQIQLARLAAPAAPTASSSPSPTSPSRRRRGTRK